MEQGTPRRWWHHMRFRLRGLILVVPITGPVMCRMDHRAGSGERPC